MYGSVHTMTHTHRATTRVHFNLTKHDFNDPQGESYIYQFIYDACCGFSVKRATARLRIKPTAFFLPLCHSELQSDKVHHCIASYEHNPSFVTAQLLFHTSVKLHSPYTVCHMQIIQHTVIHSFNTGLSSENYYDINPSVKET